MPVKLSTTLKNIEFLENKINSKLILQFYNYLQSNNTSEMYQNQNLIFTAYAVVVLLIIVVVTPTAPRPAIAKDQEYCCSY